MTSNGVNSNQRPLHLGVTEPLSLKACGEEAVKLSQLLTHHISPMLESEHEKDHRVRVLCDLSNLFKIWVQALTNTEGKMHTFGSYRLGVHSRGSDVDALCIATVRRTDFFTSFCQLLSEQPSVTDVLPIVDAYVPLIKLDYDGVPIDLLFSSAKPVEPKCVLSMNGLKVTEKILRAVPCEETFRKTLTSIKLWAKARALSSNSLGFFGGVTWAIMVARVCQLYPNAAPSTLLAKFFLFYLNWKWPEPILIVKKDDSGYWDPALNPSDRNHKMPVLTPVYPQMNTTHNVTESTKAILLDEFKTALELTLRITNGIEEWAAFFTPIGFFARFKNFIMVEATSNSAKNQLIWKGIVESKLRHFVMDLERKPVFKTIHTFSSSFPALLGGNPNLTRWFIGLKFNDTNAHLTLTGEYSRYSSFCYSTPKVTEDMAIAIFHVKRDELEKYIPQGVLAEHKTSEARWNSFFKNKPLLADNLIKSAEEWQSTKLRNDTYHWVSPAYVKKMTEKSLQSMKESVKRPSEEEEGTTSKRLKTDEEEGTSSKKVRTEEEESPSVKTEGNKRIVKIGSPPESAAESMVDIDLQELKEEKISVSPLEYSELEVKREEGGDKRVVKCCSEGSEVKKEV